MYLTIFSNQFEVGFQDDRSAKDTFNGTRKVCFCWLTISHKLLKKKKKKAIQMENKSTRSPGHRQLG
jgi:hypothetical protein